MSDRVPKTLCPRALLIGCVLLGMALICGCGATDRNVVVTLQNVPVDTGQINFTIDLNPTNHAEVALKKMFDGFIFKLPDQAMPLPDDLKGLMIVQGTAVDCTNCVLADSQSGLTVDEQTRFPMEIFLFFIPRTPRNCPQSPPTCTTPGS